AIDSLGGLGGTDDLPLLIKELSSASSTERAAARKSLVHLPGETISKSLATELKTAPAAVKAALLEVLATRRAIGQMPAFLAATVDDNAQVRGAAMAALGQIGRAEQVAPMLPGVLKAQKGGERDAAERNVAMICARIDNEDARGTALIEALDT